VVRCWRGCARRRRIVATFPEIAAMRAFHVGTVCLALMACTGSDQERGAADVRRPAYEISVSDTFRAASISAYQGEHAAAYAHIDANVSRHVGNLQRWVRQRSISAQNDGIQDMARMVQNDLRQLGFKEAELVATGGHPSVWGYYDAGASRTLAVYMMYDVQPVEPTGWNVDQFAGQLVDHPLGRVLMARGATNQKGPQRAFLNALESIIAANGTLPVNIMILAEGEEELGSPNFPQAIEKYGDRLRTASGVFFPFNSQDARGDITLNLGVKGILSFEMEARGGPHGGPAQAEIHGSYKAIVDAPAIRLVQAIASLTSRDGNTIAVPGYYDAIRPPSEEEQRLVNGMVDAWTAGERDALKAFAVERWIDSLSGAASLMQYLFTTTLNIDGMWSGYTGPGMKTILPHIATARFRAGPDPATPRRAGFPRHHVAQAERLSAGADVGHGAAGSGGHQRVQPARVQDGGHAAAGWERTVLRVHGRPGTADGDGRHRLWHRRACP
jgi:acetylornithine deacetylase/succinyl-diaminopimelate desuccinylase-like protein